MSTILDFQIQPLSAESYALTVCERGTSQPLASATFNHRVDFLTDFSVDRLNATTQPPHERFDALTDLGKKLYQELFPPTVEQVWREYKQRSEFLILCLRFAEGAAKLEVLPWETLHDGAEFIAAGATTMLTRLPLDIAPPSALPPIPRPLKLFGFFASPLDLGDHERLNAEREQEILLEAINDPAAQGRISADFEDEAKLEILERSLRDGYHILHFTGHGISPRDGGGLLLEDAHGKKLPASIAEVMQAVQRGQDGKAKLRLAVISGCQTARTLHTGAFSDLARELLRQRVPAVIAMQFSVTDDGGLKFAEVLYREIAKGTALERAVYAARRALLADKRFFINNDALAIVLLAADGACLQTTEAQSSAPQAEPGATYLGDRLDPLAHGFYGRRREYRQIRDALLHQDQRAVIIHGIGGIGKTALLTHAINRLRPRFKDVMSFDCRRAALAPETILLELHRYFATQGMLKLQSLIGKKVLPSLLANYIAQMLVQWPLLIVFDHFEMQLNEQREIANEDWRVFLTTLVEVTEVGSRFLFTSRSLFDLDSERCSNLPLGDLSRAEALMLMQKLPNLAQSSPTDERTVLENKKLVLEKFGGHPDALFRMERYCSHQSLEKALQDARSLESELRESLAIELNYWRLSDDARDLLNHLAVFRRAAPREAADWVIERVTDLNQSFEELVGWGLLMPIHNDGRLESVAVHRLMRNFCREQHQIEIWRDQLRDAASFYLAQTKVFRGNRETSDVLWDAMEAFELLMEAEEFEKATEVLNDTHPLLVRRGFGRDAESCYRRLLPKVTGHATAVAEHNYGTLLQGRGELKLALNHFEKSLKIVEETNYDVGMATSLRQIGTVYQDLGEYDAALSHYERSLEFSEKLGDRVGIEKSLYQIGQLHYLRGNYDVALEQSKRTAGVFGELRDRAGVASAQHQIGMILQDRGEYLSALDYYRQALETKKELGDRAGGAGTLHHIGMIYHLQGKYKEALEYYRQSLNTHEALQDRDGVSLSLHQIGMLYADRSEYEAALEQYHKALEIVEKIGNREREAASLFQIGNVHLLRGEYEVALEKYKESLKIAERLGDRAGIAKALFQIGMVHQEREEYELATKQYEKSLKIAMGLGDRSGIANSTYQIGVIHQERGNYEAAMAHYKKSLEIREVLSDRGGVAVSLHQIGRVHQDRGEYQEAFDKYEESLKIREELGDRKSVAESCNQIGRLYTHTQDYPEALEFLLFALGIFGELESPNAIITINALRDLRAKWGEEDFDTALQAAWQQATDEEMPEWLMNVWDSSPEIADSTTAEEGSLFGWVKDYLD